MKEKKMITTDSVVPVDLAKWDTVKFGELPAIVPLDVLARLVACARALRVVYARWDYERSLDMATPLQMALLRQMREPLEGITDTAAGRAERE